MSKVYRDLYPTLITFQNLLAAYRQAARGKRRHPQVAAFEFDREGNLLQLQRELQSKSYQPGAYYSGWIAHARHGDTWGLRRALLGRRFPVHRPDQR